MIALSQCPGIDPVKDSSAALQAALNLKQPITWDCPVNCVMGTDVTKGIFVPDGSDVTFTPAGRLDVDSAGFPALAFMHAAGTWRGLKLRYLGSTGILSPAGTSKWTNGPAHQYLQKTGYNTFANNYSGTYWTGNTNTSALITVRGASNVNFQGGKIYVDDDATADRFPLVAMSIDPAYAAGLAVTGSPLVCPTVSISDFLLDGTVMGFVGGGTVNAQRITRRRYSDLQDSAGANVGGVNNWSAPPHFFYLQGSPENPMTAKLRDIIDEAVFCGSPLRRLSSSGSMLSLKIELANGTTVDGYYSRCLDGAMDILSNGSSTGGSIKNAIFMIDTSIKTVDGKQAAWGIRYPSLHPYPASTIDAAITDVATGSTGWITNWVPNSVTTRLSVQRS